MTREYLAFPSAASPAYLIDDAPQPIRVFIEHALVAPPWRALLAPGRPRRRLLALVHSDETPPSGRAWPCGRREAPVTVAAAETTTGSGAFARAGTTLPLGLPRGNGSEAGGRRCVQGPERESNADPRLCEQRSSRVGGQGTDEPEGSPRGREGDADARRDPGTPARSAARDGAAADPDRRIRRTVRRWSPRPSPVLR